MSNFLGCVKYDKKNHTKKMIVSDLSLNCR